MPLAPPIRAIYSAISSGDLPTMRQGLALGQQVSRTLQTRAAREAEHPPPEPEEGDPPRQTAAEVLDKLQTAMQELEQAIAKAERSQKSPPETGKRPGRR